MVGGTKFFWLVAVAWWPKLHFGLNLRGPDYPPTHLFTLSIPAWHKSHKYVTKLNTYFVIILFLVHPGIIGESLVIKIPPLFIVVYSVSLIVIYFCSVAAAYHFICNTNKSHAMCDSPQFLLTFILKTVANKTAHKC